MSKLFFKSNDGGARAVARAAASGGAGGGGGGGTHIQPVQGEFNCSKITSAFSRENSELTAAAPYSH